MSYFGHVYPGLFHIAYALVGLYTARSYVTEEEAAHGSRLDKQFASVFLLACFLAGIGIEGAGGIITFNDFFFQYSHQVSYVGYFLASITAALELRHRVPNGSWKVCFAIAMLVEAWVMLGHLLMQERVEATLHAITSILAFITALCLLLSALNFNSQGTGMGRAMFLHACALTGILLKGLWFHYIAHIVYSGAYGIGGEEAHTGDLFATAGLLIVLCQAIVGLTLAVNCRGSNDDDGLGPHQPALDMEKEEGQV